MLNPYVKDFFNKLDNTIFSNLKIVNSSLQNKYTSINWKINEFVKIIKDSSYTIYKQCDSTLDKCERKQDIYLPGGLIISHCDRKYFVLLLSFCLCFNKNRKMLNFFKYWTVSSLIFCRENLNPYN